MAASVEAPERITFGQKLAMIGVVFQSSRSMSSVHRTSSDLPQLATSSTACSSSDCGRGSR